AAAAPPPPPPPPPGNRPDDAGVQGAPRVAAAKANIVADKQGPLKHLGAPVEFGAEKETNMKTMSAGDKLAPTEVQGFERALIQGKITPDMLVDGAKGKPVDQIQWADLNDKGKSAYSLAYSEKYSTAGKTKWPIIRAQPQANFSKVDFEPNGWIEVISSKFDTIRDAKVFLDKFGWGHIHTTWMRGASPEVQGQQTTWMRNANLWMFLDALESRGASSGGEGFWRFAIKGLSIPTEDHLKLALDMIKGRNMTATAFSKHLHIGLRASGKYGDRNRIGFEARGGVEDQKRRVLDSLLNGLTQGQWGTQPAKYGDEQFKLISVGNVDHQVSALPAEFRSLVAKHLQEHPVGDLKPADADRLYQLVAGATFYDGKTPAARINAFDQRGCTPLLEFEKLSWLTDAEKKRAVDARGKFIQSLADLDKRKAGMKPSQIGQAVADLVTAWSKDARLAEPFGRWLDGGERQKFFA
ncbi:hypothetical protein L6R52_44090, partial [Myxococcota bacterium]|nr:hypothetical protein [Myxococcota bacterium]